MVDGKVCMYMYMCGWREYIRRVSVGVGDGVGCDIRRGGAGDIRRGGGGKGEFRSFAVIIKEIDGGLAQLMSI